jgi:hypothetical protein
MLRIENQIASFRKNVEAFEGCIRSLNQDQFLTPLNRWSPRDIVAHLIGWNRALIEGSNQIRKGELPFYDMDPGENYSKVNDAFVKDISSGSREELLAQLNTSAEELAGFLRTLSPGDWDQDYGVRHKQAVVTIRNTMDELIEDYDHHLRQIEDWFRKQSS